METLVILCITNLILSFRTFSKLEREGISYHYYVHYILFCIVGYYAVIRG